MKCALAIKILRIAVVYTFFSTTVFGVNPENSSMVDIDGLCFEQAQADADPEIANKFSAKEGPQIEKEEYPLVKVAHRNVMDLLRYSLVAKTIHVANYTPILQHVGIRVNWFEWLQNVWKSPKKSYGVGVDCHSIGPIQFSIDAAYQSYQLQEKDCNYNSNGYYGLVALLYVMHPNPITNAYCGIGYGHSRFDVITTFNDGRTGSNQFNIAGWMQLVGGSECRLVSQLYGGMGLGIGHLLHSTENNNDRQVLNYYVPGYGRIVNKLMLDVTLYLKWSISFLEKKIVI
ncbi:hypothetical protein ACRRVB_00610 [Candidatus Cardinium hertigii]|uniref:hypothetical protein n=1 Tax=Candidatus Cardinium hertigii TaxID=247481 RepID=UPI003D7C4547